MEYFQEMNAEYEKWFSHKPARSCIAVKQLPKGVKVRDNSMHEEDVEVELTVALRLRSTALLSCRSEKHVKDDRQSNCLKLCLVYLTWVS